MMKKLACLVALVSMVFAGSATHLKDLQPLAFQDAFEKKVEIPASTKRIIVSFEQDVNKFMAEYLNSQPKRFLDDQNTVYMADIHKMPAIVTYMFARPKMQKYNFTIFLYNQDDLASFIPMKEKMATVVVLDKEGNIVNHYFAKNAKEAFIKPQ